jgi:hypothetical protein
LVVLLEDSELFILLAENSQTLLKIPVIPILLTFMYLVALNLLVNNQLNSSSNSTHRPTQLIIVAHNCHKLFQFSVAHVLLFVFALENAKWRKLGGHTICMPVQRIVSEYIYHHSILGK